MTGGSTSSGTGRIEGRELRGTQAFVKHGHRLSYPSMLTTACTLTFCRLCANYFRSADIDCAFTDFQLFGGSEDIWHNRADFTLRDMLLAQWIPGAGTLMRRSVWERTGGYWEEPAIKGNEDWDFWITAFANGLRPAHIALPLYFYRRHDQSASSYSLPYRDHAQRELLYLRHQALYDRHSLGGEFRARGYLNSAWFSWRMGERRRAMRLTADALSTRSVARPFLTMSAHSATNLARTKRWRGSRDGVLRS